MRYLHVLLSLAAFQYGGLAMAQCLKSNVDGQSAQGRLTIVRAQDAAGRPERPYILELNAAVCLDADDPDDAVKSARTIKRQQPTTTVSMPYPLICSRWRRAATVAKDSPVSVRIAVLPVAAS